MPSRSPAACQQRYSRNETLKRVWISINIRKNHLQIRPWTPLNVCAVRSCLGHRPEVPTLSSEAELTFTQEAVAPSVSATAPAPARKPARRQQRLDDPSDDDGDWAPPTAEELSQAAAVAAKV